MVHGFMRAALAALVVAAPWSAAAVEWDVSLWGQRRAATEHVHRLAELVAEKTDGEFTMNIDYGGLSKSTETLDGLSLGAFEMAQFCAGYHPDKTPSLTVLELPFLGPSTIEEELAVSRAVYAHPAAREEMARWHAAILMPTPLPQYNLAGRGEPRASLDDLTGARVGASGGIAKILEAIGAVPVRVTGTDTYQALESRAVDALALPQHGFEAYGILDIAEWWTENLDLGTLNCPVAVGVPAYEALSDEHRAALDSSVDEALQYYLDTYEALIAGWGDLLKENGVRQIALSDEEVHRLREIAAPVRGQWIADMAARGLPGEELYVLVQQTLKDVDTEE